MTTTRHVEMTIRIIYEDPLTDEQWKETQSVLNHAADHLASNGMLSGNTEKSAIVETWQAEVKQYWSHR